MRDTATQASRLRTGEKTSWAIGLGGQNILYALQMNFVLFAFVDILGLLPAAVGTLLLVARLFDGFNDPIMGAVADRTRSRWGRFRPWLIFTPIPMAVATAFMFFDPGLSYGATLVYAYVVYIGWSVLYTLTDIPLWALSSAMTRDTDTRTSLVSLGRVAAFLGMMIAGGLTPVIANAVSEDEGTGYFVAAAILAVIAAPLMMLAGLKTREHVQVDDERPSVGEMWHALKVNRPLQLIVASNILGAMSLGMASVLPFFAEYSLGDDELAGALFVVMLLGLIAGIGLTPAGTRWMGKIPLVVWTAVARAVLLVGFYVIGWDSLAIVIGIAFVLGVLSGPFPVHLSTMIGDSVDFVELETGSRYEGVAFSLQTLLAKVIAGIGAALTGFVLAMTGFVADQPQTEEALNGIFLLMTLIPAASSLLSIIPYRWYKLNERTHAEIVARLSQEV